MTGNKDGGVFRAQVVDVDDPEQSGRVRFRSANSDQTSDWADVLLIGAPAIEIGMTVIVANEGGDPRRPIVLGALASS